MNKTITSDSRKSLNIKVEILYFTFAIIISLFSKNSIIAFILFSSLILINKSFILAILLVIPLIETILILSEGFTITKFISFFLLWLFIVELIHKNNFIFDKRVLYLFLFILCVIIGVFNAIISMHFGTIIEWNYNYIINENFLANIPKVIFALILYMYLSSKGKDFLMESLKKITELIPLFLIIISLYFIFIGHETGNWWNIITRYTFEKSDPNEFASMLSAFSVVILYNLFYSKSKFSFFINMTSYLLTLYSVYLTFSRGGILSFLFAFIISLLFFSNKRRKRVLLLVTILLFLVIFLFSLNIINYQLIYERFFGEKVNSLSDFTAGRFDFWKAAIINIYKSPILGFGSSEYTSRWLNYESVGRMNVSHNIYLEVLIQLGIVGIFLLFLIIIKTILDFLSITKSEILDRKYVIVFLSLFTMLFAGIGLSWQWRELLWYFIGIAFSIGKLNEKNYREF